MYFQIKKILLVAVLFFGGLVLIGVGIKNYRESRQLVASGKQTMATVLERNEVKAYKETKIYHFILAFETESKGRFVNNVMVQKDLFEHTAVNDKIAVCYLPSDPSVCMLPPIEVRCGQLISGIGFTIAGVLLGIAFLKFPNFGKIRKVTEDEMIEHARPVARDAAKKIVTQLAPLTEARHEWEITSPKKFPHLDIAFYDQTRQVLESHGFVYLEDSENVTLRNSANNPNTFLRTMLGSNGTVMAGIYQFKPSFAKRLLGIKEVKVLDLETQFSNGCFVCTNNAESAGKLTTPPEVDSLSLVGATPFLTLLQVHRTRVLHFTEKSNAQPVRLNGMADVRRAQDQLQEMKAAYRKKVGLSRGEIERLGGGGKREVDLLFQEISKEHEKTR